MSARLPAAVVAAVSLLVAGCNAGSGTRAFVRPLPPAVALLHVRIIDGTGGPAREDQTLLIDHGRIAAAGTAAEVRIPEGAGTLDLAGRTVMPGLVGMHEHLFYELESPPAGHLVVNAQTPFARLYLASGVTTIRTAGTVDFDEDARLKARIDAGQEPGPAIHLTGPYLSAVDGAPDPERIARAVEAQADRGATSIKAYTSLRPAELKAAIATAHARGLRITGHLCAVGFREAATLGIDTLEHGLAVDTEFYSDKQPDDCPEQGAFVSELARMDVGSAEIQQTLALLVRRGVSVTSTLAIFESFTGREAAFDPALPALLAPTLRDRYVSARPLWSSPASPTARMWSAMLKREMEFERQFVAAGGRLLAGVDPTGWGGVVAGLGDQRELELLVDAGLTPEAAIRVATSNGATALGESERIGTIAAGKQADLVVVRGNPATRISDIRQVEVVFKDGIAYDPGALKASIAGTVGVRDPWQPLHRRPVQLILGLVALLAVAAVGRRLSRSTRRASLAIALGLAATGCAMHADGPSLEPEESSDVQPRLEPPLHKGYVDLAMGLYIREDDDLVVPAPFPLVLRRTYESGDDMARPFGLGATHPGEWWLYGNGDPRIPWADLILANGGRVHFERVSPGNTQADAVLTHTGSDPFDGASLRWDGTRWVMTFRDGGGAAFADCPPNDCSVLERWDAAGNRVTYHRGGDGRLLEMRSGPGRIWFHYDDRRRVDRVGDTLGRQVDYTYDDHNRLVRAEWSDGVVRRYAYNTRNQLIGVTEPGRMVSNQFDDAGRVVAHVAYFGPSVPRYELAIRYVGDGRAITETHVTRNDGSRSVYRFDEQHHSVSETHEPPPSVRRAAAR
jgi:YD repeat-containing protein